MSHIAHFRNILFSYVDKNWRTGFQCALKHFLETEPISTQPIETNLNLTRLSGAMFSMPYDPLLGQKRPSLVLKTELGCVQILAYIIRFLDIR